MQQLTTFDELATQSSLRPPSGPRKPFFAASFGERNGSSWQIWPPGKPRHDGETVPEGEGRTAGSIADCGPCQVICVPHGLPAAGHWFNGVFFAVGTVGAKEITFKCINCYGLLEYCWIIGFSSITCIMFVAYLKWNADWYILNTCCTKT